MYADKRHVPDLYCSVSIYDARSGLCWSAGSGRLDAVVPAPAQSDAWAIRAFDSFLLAVYDISYEIVTSIFLLL